MRSSPKRKLPVEGGGPIGCGCGILLGAAIAFLAITPFDRTGFLFVGVLALVAGVLGWRLGDSFFEKVLDGDPEGKPLRYWWWW